MGIPQSALLRPHHPGAERPGRQRLPRGNHRRRRHFPTDHPRHLSFVQCFIGTCVWLLLSEILPLAIRGFAMGVAVFVLWTVNAAISFAFPIVNNALGSTGTLPLFVAVNLISLGFVSKFIPETKRRSLEELETDFRTGWSITPSVGVRDHREQSAAARRTEPPGTVA